MPHQFGAGQRLVFACVLVERTGYRLPPSCTRARRPHMPYSTIKPVDAKPVANYKMATRMEGGRLLYISGQVAWDANGNIVGQGDIGAQARQVFQNVRGVLQAAGGDLANLLKITSFITKID